MLELASEVEIQKLRIEVEQTNVMSKIRNFSCRNLYFPVPLWFFFNSNVIMILNYLQCS